MHAVGNSVEIMTTCFKLFEFAIFVHLNCSNWTKIANSKSLNPMIINFGEKVRWPKLWKHAYDVMWLPPSNTFRDQELYRRVALLDEFQFRWSEKSVIKIRKLAPCLLMFNLLNWKSSERADTSSRMKTGLNDQVLHFWLARQWQHMDHPIELHSNDCA